MLLEWHICYGLKSLVKNIFALFYVTHHTRSTPRGWRGVDSQVLSWKLRTERGKKRMFWNFVAFFLSYRWFVTWHRNWPDTRSSFYFSPTRRSDLDICVVSGGDINFRFMKEQPQGLPLEALLAPSGARKHPWRDFCCRFGCKNPLLTRFFRWVCFFFLFVGLFWGISFAFLRLSRFGAVSERVLGKFLERNKIFKMESVEEWVLALQALSDWQIGCFESDYIVIVWSCCVKCWTYFFYVQGKNYFYIVKNICF